MIDVEKCKGCFIKTHLVGDDCVYTGFNEECPCVECLVKVVCDELNCQPFIDFENRCDRITAQRTERFIHEQEQQRKQLRRVQD